MVAAFSLTGAATGTISEITGASFGCESIGDSSIDPAPLLQALGMGAIASGVNYELRVLSYLEQLITALGGSVPPMPFPSNFRERHLQLLATLSQTLA